MVIRAAALPQLCRHGTWPEPPRRPACAAVGSAGAASCVCCRGSSLAPRCAGSRPPKELATLARAATEARMRPAALARLRRRGSLLEPPRWPTPAHAAAGTHRIRLARARLRLARARLRLRSSPAPPCELAEAVALARAAAPDSPRSAPLPCAAALTCVATLARAPHWPCRYGRPRWPRLLVPLPTPALSCCRCALELWLEENGGEHHRKG